MKEFYSREKILLLTKKRLAPRNRFKYLQMKGGTCIFETVVSKNDGADRIINEILVSR